MSVLRLADDLSLPRDVITETVGILAARGAGKSNTAAVLAEEMHRSQLPFVVIDPVGSWFGLRSSSDGSGPGLPIPIFGGRHGDVPLERSGGAVVADIIVEHRLSCVLDLTEFESEAAKKVFLLDFARRLYQRNEQPLHLFLEEADDYIPQRPMRDEAQLLRAWENIVRRGRSRGLGMTLITQRSASINKSVLTQVQTLIAMRTTGPQDRAAIEDWLQYHDQSREILASLPSLQDGEAWVWSPQFLKTTVRVQFRRRETFDSGATPKVASMNRPPATLADVDLGAIRDKMAETIEQVKAEDPAELRRQITTLQADIRTLNAKLQKAQATPAKTVSVPTVPLGAGQALDRLRHFQGKFAAVVADFERAFDGMGEAGAVKTGGEIVAKYSATIPESASRQNLTTTSQLSNASDMGAPVKREQLPQTSPQTRTEMRKPPSPDRFANVSGPQQRILDAIARLNGAGIATPKRRLVATVAGYRLSGNFNNLISSLNSAGLVEYPSGGLVELTDSGRSTANTVPAIATLEELHVLWRALLTAPQVALLNVLIEHYPEAMTREELAAATGYHLSGNFHNLVSTLRSFDAAEYPAKGYVRATDLLFPLELQS